MKKSMKMFGALCAAVLAFAVACSDGDDSASSGRNDTVYRIGEIVTFEGGQYLVTKNTETTSRSVARASANSDSGLYYQNENAAAYREKLLQEYGVTKYVELFDITTRKDTGNKDVVNLNDEYLILQNGVKAYHITQSWQSTTLFSDSSVAKKAEQFNALTEDELRQGYDPDYFMFESYPNDLSKKIKIQYAFNRNDDGTVNFDSLYKIQTWKAYVTMSDGKQKSVYRIEERAADSPISYSIQDPSTGSNFFFLWLRSNGTFYLSTEGDGDIGGSASQSVYRNKVSINKALQYDTSSKKLEITYNVERTVNDEVVESASYVFGNNTEKDKTYVNVSDEKITIASHDVPKEITFFAPYQDTNAALNKYTNVVLVPKTNDDGNIVYAPKTDETYEFDFIAQYAKDFQSLYK